MNTVKLLTQLVENHEILVYGIIFLFIVIEGEFILLCTGILAHLGAIDFYPTLLFVFIAGMAKTFTGYYIGTLIHKKWHKTKLLKYITKRVSHMMPHFQEKPFWSIFISKFILVNHAVIIYAGYKKIKWQEYLKAEFCSTLIWAPGLMLLGYFFSYTAIRISHEIWRFSLIVLVLIALFIILDRLVSWAYEVFEEFYHDA